MHYTKKDRLEGRCSHREFFAQFVDQAIIQLVHNLVGTGRVMSSKDEWFRDIHAKKWRSIARFVPATPIFRANGSGGVSISDRVCVLKEAASQIREVLDEGVLNPQHEL